MVSVEGVRQWHGYRLLIFCWRGRERAGFPDSFQGRFVESAVARCVQDIQGLYRPISSDDESKVNNSFVLEPAGKARIVFVLLDEGADR